MAASRTIGGGSIIGGRENLQPTSIRTAVGKVMGALREAARRQGPDVHNDTERLFSEGRGRLLLDRRVMEIMPGSLARNQSASRLVAAISQGPDDRVAAVERFCATLEETLRRLEQQGMPVDAVNDGGSPQSQLAGGEAILDETGEPILDGTGEPLLDEGPQPVRQEAAGLATGLATVSGVGEAVTDSAAWTGVQSRSQRLVVLRSELEIAQAAVGQMIDGLVDEERGNGGPPLDEHEDALRALRQLHRTLGDLLGAIDRGALSDELGDSLAADVARFGLRAANALRGDPAKFMFALTTFGLLSACGAGDWGGFLSSALLQVPQKKAG